MVKYTDEDEKETKYKYDLHGNVIEKREQNQKPTIYKYDRKGRLLRAEKSMNGFLAFK